MRELTVDVAIIGGGPAGLAAALEVARRGRSCAILERNTELGGILQQCIHDGFGLIRFGESVSGCAYAQRFIDRLEAARAGGARIEVLLDTMVLELAANREIWATNPSDGMVHVRACAVILLGLHIGGCAGDLYDTRLYFTRFRDPMTLMRDTGPAQTFYVKKG